MIGMIAFTAFVAAQFLAVICARGWHTANGLPDVGDHARSRNDRLAPNWL
jgi:hypothetical protein